ncbi:MAG: polysaccharide deacetylase family protein, partial [Rhodanobacter sp.]
RMIHRPTKMQLLQWLPRSLVLTRAPQDERSIYLTFDDGPNLSHTPALLDLLSREGAKATFFMIGRHAESHPELAARVVAEGHKLGNHSYNHPVFNNLALAEQVAEIDRTDRVLARFDGIDCHPFRPPRGVFSLGLLLHAARKRRRLTYWSYDSLDYRHKDATKLVELLRAKPPRAGDVLLMHDDDDCSTRVLEIMLPEWRELGFRFQVLPA